MILTSNEGRVFSSLATRQSLLATHLIHCTLNVLSAHLCGGTLDEEVEVAQNWLKLLDELFPVPRLGIAFALLDDARAVGAVLAHLGVVRTAVGISVGILWRISQAEMIGRRQPLHPLAHFVVLKRLVHPDLVVALADALEVEQ
eukprot:3552542-Prymnesium_polylepis.3